MFIKKKLRDLSEEEAKNTNCSLKWIVVNDPNSPFWWFRNKDLYSDKFLDQEVEIEVPDLLTKEEKEYLKGILNALKVKGKLKSIHVHNSFISLHFSTKSGIDELPLPFTRNIPYSFLGLISSIHYTPEELGL